MLQDFFTPRIAEGHILKNKISGAVAAVFGSGGNPDFFLCFLQKAVDPFHAGNAFKQLRKSFSSLQGGPDQAGFQAHQGDERSVGGLTRTHHQRAGRKEYDAAENIKSLVHGFQGCTDFLPLKGFLRIILIGGSVALCQDVRKLILPDGQKAGQDVCGPFRKRVVGTGGQKFCLFDSAGKGGVHEQAEDGDHKEQNRQGHIQKQHGDDAGDERQDRIDKFLQLRPVKLLNFIHIIEHSGKQFAAVGGFQIGEGKFRLFLHNPHAQTGDGTQRNTAVGVLGKDGKGGGKQEKNSIKKKSASHAMKIS